MSESWESRFVDKQVDQAWLDLRLRLADRLAAALAEGGTEGLGISGPAGQKLTVLVEDGTVMVLTDELNTATTDNVDEAAHTVYQVLHDEWQVVHPAFLETDLVDTDATETGAAKSTSSPGAGPATGGAGTVAPDGEGVPALGQAESAEQLHTWVVATLERRLNSKLRVDNSGAIAWRTRGGNRVVLNVRNAGRIELSAVLAREVNFTRAHALIDKLSRQWFALKFFLERDNLIVAQLIVAHPFVAAQLVPALKAFMRDVDQFAWVQEAVERKRTRKLRDEVERLRQATEKLAEAKRAAEEERDRAKRAYRKIRRELRAERESREEE